MNDLLARSRRGEVLRVLGLMSGTSLDGVDLAIIETDGERVHGLGPSRTVPYDDSVRDAARAVFGATTPSPATVHAERLITDAHSEAVTAFLRGGDHGARAVDIIGFHGQTISHRPAERFTWQIGDGAALARAAGVPVVADFRSADVAAGGQGAPLVPVYHQALARQAVALGRMRLPVAILNIGGVANVTWIGEDGALLAFDTGPGNAPLDDWLRRHGGSFDRDGNVSGAGAVDQGRLARLLSSDYFGKIPPKSLDRNDFSSQLADGLPLADGAATLAAACAAAVAAAVDHMPAPPMAWLVCGGGARNPTILRELAARSAIGVEVAGGDWMGDVLEAQAFGYLAVRSLRGLPLTFPSTTGVPSPLTGGRLFNP
ncbi:MAG TPA: anhydro-N-acetylmuramic acid kinase [Vineibacter sp.]|nr:anhydro-N-acetylmuramic acid kinase [Vineibacter sp.]